MINRKLFIFILIFIFLPILSACNSAKKPDNFLIVALRSDPLFLNPVTASEMSSQTVNSLIFNALVKYNEKMEIEPDLAESYEVSGDNKTWTFYLKKGVKWHDGSDFTSKDVKFTFEKLFDKKTNTFNRGLFQINGEEPKITVLDDYTVSFELPEPFTPFLSNLTQMGIIPEHILKNEDINRSFFNSHPIGTGPFVFSEWRSSERVILKANPNYFNGKPKLKGLVFNIIPSSESRRIALMTDCVDISEITSEDLRALESCSNIIIYRWDQFAYYYMGFDLTAKPFDDRNVRRAINYALNKEQIIKAIFKDNAIRATGPIPKASRYYCDSVETYAQDKLKAEKLLRESGWIKDKNGIFVKDGRKFEFELIYPSGNAPCEKAAVFIQAQLKDIGVVMNLKAMEFSALLNCCYPGKFQAIILNWVEMIDPDCYTEWHSSQMGDLGMNFMSYSNEKVDKLLKEGRIQSDSSKRMEIYRQFQHEVVSDSPYVFLWIPKGLTAVSKRVKGNTIPNAGGIFMNSEKIYLEKEL